MHPLAGAAFVVAREERVLSIIASGSYEIFDPVEVDLDATVGEEGLQPVPLFVDIGELFAQPRLGGYSATLCLSHSPDAGTSGAVRACRGDRRWPGEVSWMSASTA